MSNTWKYCPYCGRKINTYTGRCDKCDEPQQSGSWPKEE